MVSIVFFEIFANNLRRIKRICYNNIYERNCAMVGERLSKNGPEEPNEGFDEKDPSLLRSDYIGRSTFFDGEENLADSDSMVKLQNPIDSDTGLSTSEELDKDRERRFRKKRDQYSMRIRDLLEGESLDEDGYYKLLLNSFEKGDPRIEKIAEETIQGFDKNDLHFFRSEYIRRCKAFSGHEDTSDGNSSYVELVWLFNADKGFGESKELFDFFFGEQQFEPRAIKKQLREMGPRALSFLRQKRLKWELAGDLPVHYEKNGHLDPDDYKQYERIRSLWGFDGGWMYSREKWAYFDYLEKNIYNPNRQEAGQYIDSALDMINFDEVRNILDSKNFKENGEILVSYLSRQLDIEAPNVVLEPREPWDEDKGMYVGGEDNTIIVRYDNSNMTNNWAPADFDTIVHEFWHAVQNAVSEGSDQRSYLYKVNLRNYASSDEKGYMKYYYQLVEFEARLFALKFTELTFGHDHEQGTP